MATPTVPEIIQIAEISQYLVTNAIYKGGLNGGGIDLELPRKIYCIRKNVQWLYDLDPTDSTLNGTAKYLYALCAPYNIAAQRITGGGGTVAPIVPISDYQYYVLSKTWSNLSSYVYQNDVMIGALDIDYIIVNNVIETVAAGQFTINTTTGTITRTNPFFSGDVIVIPMLRLTTASFGETTLATPTLVATVISNTEIDLSVTAITNATGYYYQRADDAGFTVNLTTLYQGTNLIYHDTGLTISTTYYYRVLCYADGYQDSAYDDTSATTSGTWTPANLTSLWGWFDAAQGVTGTTQVSSWADQSGNANDLLQATSNRQPRLTTGVINSLPVIELNSTLNSQARMVTGSSFPFTTGATIYMVASQAISGLHSDASGVYCEYSLDSVIGRDISTTTLNADLNGDAQVQTTLVDGTFYTIGIVTSNTDENLYINGTLIGTDSSVVAVTQQAFYIFQNHSNANTGNKQFAEIIVCDAEISSGDRASLTTYLKDKYAHY